MSEQTFDLLSTLNLPYKITYAIYVLVTLFSGFMAANSPKPGRFLGTAKNSHDVSLQVLVVRLWHDHLLIHLVQHHLPGAGEASSLEGGRASEAGGRFDSSNTSRRKFPTTRTRARECPWPRKLVCRWTLMAPPFLMFSAGFRNKNVRNPLQTALSTYFCIWMAYPILWILLETNAISRVTEHCINVVMDVLAKSICANSCKCSILW